MGPLLYIQSADITGSFSIGSFSRGGLAILTRQIELLLFVSLVVDQVVLHDLSQSVFEHVNIVVVVDLILARVDLHLGDHWLDGLADLHEVLRAQIQNDLDLVDDGLSATFIHLGTREGH